MKKSYHKDVSYLSHHSALCLNDAEDCESKGPIDRKHVICVYNEKFSDKTQVFEAESSIRKVYHNCQLSYKPDIFTYLGIYRKNKWNIRPTLYSTNRASKTYQSDISDIIRNLDIVREHSQSNNSIIPHDSVRSKSDNTRKKDRKQVFTCGNEKNGPSIDDWMESQMSQPTKPK